MVSAISICLLAIGLTAVSSHSFQNDADYLETPPSDRRTFSHKKPVKVLPIFKKHKKFGGIVPHHIFGKAPATEIVYQEAPRPIYKVHRYQGIEVKPVSDVSYSTPEPIIETHSIEPPTDDFVQTFSSDHAFTPSFYPEHGKPVFSSPSVPLPSPPKPIFSYVPAPPQPVFSSIPITSIAPPAFSVARPAPTPIQPLPPVFAPIPASIPANPLPSIPASFPSHSQTPIPVSFPSNPIPSVPASLPSQPIIPVPIKIPIPVLPPVPAPSPAPVFSTVKIPPPQAVLPAPAQPILQALPQPILPAPAQPVLPSLPQPQAVLPPPPQPIIPAPSPAPLLPSISPVAPTPVPALSSLPVSLPPVQFSVLPSPLPPLPAFHPPSIPATPEPEFPYPPSGTPIPSYVKDISLGNIEIKDQPLPAIEAPKYEEVTPTIPDVGSKDVDVNNIKTGSGFFQKIKGWKADKVNSALSFAHFKPNPPTFDLHPSPAPVDLPAPQPALQFPAPLHPLPPAPAAVFFPAPQFFPPPKYENFPPNNIESPPPLLNSYGVPIPHNTYAPAHASHERLSSAASEEQPSVVQAPAEKQEQNPDTQNQTPQSPFQPQAIPHEHPVYVPEESKTIKEEKNTGAEDGQSETANEPNPQDDAPNSLKYPNHKE